MFEIKGKYTTAKVMIDDVEPECIAQITGFVNHPAFTNPVVIQPDTHTGKSSCVGFTMPMTDKIIPNVIGVDVGCGTESINVGTEIPISLSELDKRIREKVPFGHAVNDKAVIHFKNDFPWAETNELARKFAIAYADKFGKTLSLPGYTPEWFEKKCKEIKDSQKRIIEAIGSLGGGNHFIEIGKDLPGNYWFTIHTGSRHFGKSVCDYWQHRATEIVDNKKTVVWRERIQEIKKQYTGSEIEKRVKAARADLGIGIKDDLHFLEGQDAIGYLFDMVFAQKYAETNRAYIAKAILEILGVPVIDRIETVHNFIDFKDFIIRKGAIRAYEGERAILPFNMRDGILICEGKSNSAWNFSGPHGAGRVLSRSKAKKTLDMAEFVRQMSGIFSTSVNRSTLDEAPGAYKDAKVIETAIQPTFKVLNRIVTVMNMKDTE